MKGETMEEMREFAVCDQLGPSSVRVADALTRFLHSTSGDAQRRVTQWTAALREDLPAQGVGLEETLELLCSQVIPNGLPMTRPGCSAYIMTAPTTAAMMARLAASLASPQRFGKTAFHLLEGQALQWLKQLFCLPVGMQGVFTSGGSTANLVALGAARQQAFRGKGYDAAENGIIRAGRIFASRETHLSVRKSAGLLGLGRNSVQVISCDSEGRINLEALERAVSECVADNMCPIAIVANAGTTSTGVIDPIAGMAEIAGLHGIWLHVDGAYGLPGILDERYATQFDGVSCADSVSVDPHKWLGTTIGVGAVFVKDRKNLTDCFCHGESDYLQSAWSEEQVEHSLLDFGEPFSELSVELSAPARGVEVWAVLKEIGRAGLRARVRRHNSMALALAEVVRAHPRLQLLTGPHLSICCFRYRDPSISNLDEFNRRLHRQLFIRGENMPSTTLVNGQFALRPCFISARTDMGQVDALIEDVVHTGDKLLREVHGSP